MGTVEQKVPSFPAPPRSSTARAPLALSFLLGVGVIVLIAHLLVNLFGPYGIHRDEFLYLAMGRHLKLWAMEFPPMIALIARTTLRFLGDSIVAIRVVPALAHLLLIVGAGMAAREFGGGRFAQGLAAISVATATIFLRPGNLFQPTILDQLWWTLALLALARIGRTMEEGGTGDPVAWLWLGVAAGLGLLTKFSIGFIGVGMFVGLLISPQRRALFTRWPYEAVLIALLIGSPSIVGQFQLHFPVVGQMNDLQSTQLDRVGYLDFLGGQLMILGPMLVVLVVVGAARLLVAPAARGHRALVWSCIATFVLLMFLHGKAYYIAPIYPVLIGAGAAAVELWTSAISGHVVGRMSGNVLRGLVVAFVLLFAIIALPMGLPLLPPHTMARYSNALGVTAAVTTNHGRQLTIPQDYADMLGWPKEAEAVARAYKALPPDKQKQAVVWGANYGQAGALEYYAKRFGLPPVVSAAGSFWFFGPGARPGNVIITIGEDSAGVAKAYRVVRPAWRVTNPIGVPEEQDVLVIVGEQPHKTLQQLWPSLKGRH